jgi:hypothetical protein
VNKHILIFSAEGIQEHSSQWIMKEPMNSHRHLPGVGTHNEQIFVVGGTNDNWEAQPMVESYDPALNRNVFMITEFIYIFIHLLL